MKTNLKNLLVVILERLHTQAARVSYRFAFSKSDRRAIGILSGLIALTLFLRAHVPGKPAREWATSVEETAFLRPSALSGITDRPCEGQDGKRQKSSYVPPHYMVKRKFTVDLNMADTFDLQEIRGIGPAFARRIVNYREMLGGFIRLGQLREVWGIDSSLSESIKAHVYIKKTELRQIDINEADIKTLKKHPYLDYYQAKEIYLHRQRHGRFTEVDDVRCVNLIDSGTFARIAPYLSVESGPAR